MPTASERWRHVPLRWRVVLIVLAVIIGAELTSSTFTGLSGSGGGASGPSSSYSSSSTGTEALAQLLSDRGHRVERLTVSLGGTTVPEDSTVFVLDPTSWTTSDTRTLIRAVADGDRVVFGGRPPAGVLRSLLGSLAPPSWRPEAAGVTHPVADLPEVADVRTVIAPGAGVYAPAGSATTEPLLRGPAGDLALVARMGGTVVLLASSSPLENGSLGRADNAALALHLASARSPVVFDEYDHGFGRSGTGLAGLPASWRWGLGFALLALFIWVVSAARRFGPPDRPGRITVPPRVGYVDAMATLLSTRPPEQVVEAVAPVRAEARRRLCRRLGLPPDAPDEAVIGRLADTGADAGVSTTWVEAVLRPPSDAADVVAVGTALARLDREVQYR
jgi:hypothetical protein